MLCRKNKREVFQSIRGQFGIIWDLTFSLACYQMHLLGLECPEIDPTEGAYSTPMTPVARFREKAPRMKWDGKR